MTDTNSYRKWFYRCTLLLIALAATYVVIQPQYNFAHWVPHGFLRWIGVPYSVVLAAESNADKLLHPLLAFMLTILLHRADIKPLQVSIYHPMCVLCLVILAAELIQLAIGRGFELSDVILGVLGSYFATRFQYRMDKE